MARGWLGRFPRRSAAENPHFRGVLGVSSPFWHRARLAGAARQTTVARTRERPGRGGASGLFPNFSFREEFRHEGEFWVVRGVGVKERVDMRSLITRLLRDDEGQDLVEYVLLVSLIALAVAAAFPPVTAAITGVFNSVATAVGGGGGGGVP
jgi:Flp pilus assembly pilin Flp